MGENMSMDLEEERQREGYEFEKYVYDLFPKSKFDFEKTPTRYEDAIDNDIETNNKPDLCVRIKNTKFKIWIECKFVKDFVKNGDYLNLNWTIKSKLERYKKFEETVKEPVYVAIGVGGMSDNPNRLFLIPLRDIEHEVIFESIYVMYERPVDAIIQIGYTLK